MKDYICIVALLVAFGSLTMVVSGCEVKQNQTATGAAAAPDNVSAGTPPPAEAVKAEE